MNSVVANQAVVWRNAVDDIRKNSEFNKLIKKPEFLSYSAFVRIHAKSSLRH
jgi:hypothetical protein